jgi:predicted Zn-ribbon and HTH transcriptional regulator
MDEIKELRKVGERIATSLELLVKSATDDPIKFEVNPPVCPHCGVFNPVVEVHESTSTGPLSQLVIEAKCLSCNEIMYGMIESYSMHTTVEEVTQMVSEREEGGFCV